VGYCDRRQASSGRTAFCAVSAVDNSVFTDIAFMARVTQNGILFQAYDATIANPASVDGTMPAGTVIHCKFLAVEGAPGPESIMKKMSGTG